SVREMRFVAIDLEPTGDGAFRVKLDASEQPIMQDLATLSDYSHRFLPSHSVYHPNEIAADLLARIVLAEDVLPGKAPPEANSAFAEARQVFKPLQERFEQVLGDSPSR
ncbi:MAG TPA: hypothetical protein VN541_01625, partial [Tepidisphaeraceae bacterium]|nr:hypothetical protein [Tepidisphaeraceae bacterium]